MLNVALLLTFLATLDERLVEKFVKPIEAIAPYAAYVALVLGVAFGIIFRVDLFNPLLSPLGIQPINYLASNILSGLLIGGGSTFVHDTIDLINGLTPSSPPPRG